MLTDVASLGWRVVAFGSALAFWIDSAVARFLPGRLGRYAATHPVGTAGLIVVFALLIARGLVLAAPYMTSDPVALEDLKQQQGIYDDREPAEIGAARGAIELFGGTSVLLVLGSMAGDPPFRRRRVPGTKGAEAPAEPFLAVRLSGIVEINHVLRRVRDERSALRIDRAVAGLPSLVFYARRAGKPRPLGLQIPVSEISDVEVGQAYGLLTPLAAMRFESPVGRLTIGFERAYERDLLMEALGSATV
jgi:hypothetical protein